ncbi:hypothetical protein ACLOJK_018317 [Asimina triloba]
MAPSNRLRRTSSLEARCPDRSASHLRFGNTERINFRSRGYFCSPLPLSDLANLGGPFCRYFMFLLTRLMLSATKQTIQILAVRIFNWVWRTWALQKGGLAAAAATTEVLSKKEEMPM